MSFDFAPTAYWEANPMPPPRGKSPPDPPWRSAWAAAEFARGSVAADVIRTTIAGRSGPGVDVGRRLLDWAWPGLQAAYDAKDGRELRGCAAALCLAAGNLPEALEWFHDEPTVAAEAVQPVPAAGRPPGGNATRDLFVADESAPSEVLEV